MRLSADCGESRCEGGTSSHSELSSQQLPLYAGSARSRTWSLALVALFLVLSQTADAFSIKPLLTTFSVSVTSSTNGGASATPAAGGTISGIVPQGQSLSVTINIIGYNQGTASGTVTCYADGTQFYTKTAPGLGTLTTGLTTSWTASTVGSHSLYCHVSTNYSNTSTQNVTLTAGTTPTLSVSTSATPVVYGTSVTFTATISSGPAGTIAFRDSGTSIGSGTISGTSATFTTSSLTAGSHSIAAYYPGGGTYGAATSSAITETVNQATPTITWNTPSPITYGTALSSTQLNATASTAGTFAYSPASGTILSVGSQTLTTTFTPTDTTDYKSATGSVTLAVNPAPTNVSVSCTPTTFNQGQTTSCTATVPTGATGTISFAVINGSSESWETVAVSSGQATATNGLGTLAAGTYQVTASYSGNSSYQASLGATSVIVASSSSSSPIYSFNVGSGYDPVGNVVSYSDSVTGTWSNIAYDTLNPALASHSSSRERGHSVLLLEL